MRERERGRGCLSLYSLMTKKREIEGNLVVAYNLREAEPRDTVRKKQLDKSRFQTDKRL